MKARKVDPSDLQPISWYEVEFGNEHLHFPGRRIRVQAADNDSAMELVKSMSIDELAPMVPVRFRPEVADLLLQIFPVKEQ